MQQQKHLFIMDPIEKLNLALDSSLRIAFALSKKGEKVYFCQMGDLYWESGKDPHSAAKAFTFNGQASAVNWGPTEQIRLDTFASIHMRKDPPFDINYITATWFLEHCGEALLVNNPAALRGFNEKMGILNFPEACKQSLVSSNPIQLFNFMEQHCNGDAILKPLHLYGGKGITHLQTHSNSNSDIQSKLNELTENGTHPFLVQAFDSNIYEGEIRAFLVGGKALSWCLKVPKKGEFLANTAAGASLHAYAPSSGLVSKVEALGKKLLKQGIYFVGLDIISEEVTEINITSPRLLVAPGDSRDYYEEIAKWILSQ